MAYRSRRYIAEKYEPIKYDIESYLDVFNKEIRDKLTDEEVEKVKGNIIENMKAIIKELEKWIMSMNLFSLVYMVHKTIT